MLPVPADRPLPSTPPWQIQIPNPSVDAPQYLLQLVPFVVPKLANLAYQNQNNQPLGTLTHNILSSNNWANDNMRLAVRLTLLYVMSAVGPNNLPQQNHLDTMVETAYQLYSSYLVKLFPELQTMLPADVAQSVNQNIQIADNLLTQPQMAPMQPNYGVPAPQPPTGRNLAGGAPTPNVTAPPPVTTNVTLPGNTFSNDDFFTGNSNTGSIIESDEKQSPIVTSKGVCESVPFLQGEEIPPMVHTWEDRKLVARGNRKYWRIVVDRDKHQLVTNTAVAKNPLEVGVRELMSEEDIDKGEALAKMVEESIVRNIHVTAMGYTEIQNILLAETYGLAGSDGFSVVNGIVLNTTVGYEKSEKIYYVPRDAKVNGAIPKTVTGLAQAINRRLRQTGEVPDGVLDEFTEYYTGTVNSKLYHSFGSEVYVEQFDVDFSDMDEVYDALRSELPESVFSAFEEWDSEFLKSFKEIKKTGDNSVDNIVTPLTITDCRRVVLPEAYTFIVVDMERLGYDVDDIRKSVVESPDPTAALRVDTRNASHLDAILNRVAELSDMHGPVILVDANTNGVFRVGVEFSYIDENWVLCKPVF